MSVDFATMKSPVDWNIPSFAESNRAAWGDEMDATDGVFALVSCGPVVPSPFKVTRKNDAGEDEIVYERDPINPKEFLLDEQGQKIPKIRYQTQWTWEVLWLDHPKGDDYVGQTFTQYYTPSMSTQANMYEAVKALFGGNVDPSWKPHPSDIEGRVLKATLRLGKANEKGQRWPKLDGYRPDRSGMTYTPKSNGYDTESDVPF